MKDHVKCTEVMRIPGKRKHMRASTRESATLLLDGIGEVVGHASDIGFGGVFFTSESDLSGIPLGSVGTIAFTMFNTLVDMRCKVASSREGGLGIEIQRHYSMEDLKEKVRAISTDQEGPTFPSGIDGVVQLLRDTTVFLRKLAESSDREYSQAEAGFLADKADQALAAFSKVAEK